MSDASKPLAASQSEYAADETSPLAELEPEALANVARSPQSVAVIGGGLAGMAAAAAACQHGLQVDLFEQSDRLGGRAGSFQEPWNGQAVDLCQHVAMGCCGSFIDFCRRVGVEDCFQRHKTLHFIGPDGRQSDFTTAGWLPPPYHMLPGLLRLKYLSWQECWEIVRALRKLIRLKIYEENEIDIISSWLRRQRQSKTAIELFWSVVLIGALSETVDFASLAAAKKVFADGFCASRRAYELITPRVSLGEIFDRRVPSWLERHEVRIHRGARVMEVVGQDTQGVAMFLHDGTVRNFHAAIVAVPWFEAPYLFSSSPVNFSLELDRLKQIPDAAITAVHLWFDRPITPLPHAALVGRLSQWIFNETVLTSENTRPYPSPLPTADAVPGKGTFEAYSHSYYYQIVISAADRVASQDKMELLQTVLSDLQAVFPGAREMRNCYIDEW